MALTKEDTLHAKGIAIFSMLMLHLFCRLGNLPYTPLIWIGDTPLIYYLGLFGDICVPIYCFCAGYTHYLLLDHYPSRYTHQIPNKIIRFLVNYWIIVVIFSLVGFFFDPTDTIPGSWKSFIGNILIFGMSYNGAWWFVITYLILLIFSPLDAKFVKKSPTLLILASSTLIYFISYMFRFNWHLELQSPILSNIWENIILFGTSQFSYFLGMLVFKHELPQKLRKFFDSHNFPIVRASIIIILPLLAFIGHCIIQSLIVAPITALIVLLSLFLAKRPPWLDDLLSFLGHHSTNIWFTHMFFYLTLFNGLVFYAKYPILILGMMLAICIPVSIIITALYKKTLRVLRIK